MQSYWEKVKPWTCPACGQKNISANKGACPKCYMPRDGSTPAPVPVAATPAPESTPAPMPATVQATRTFEGEKELKKGIAEMAKKGWHVASQSSYQPNSGVGRTLALGVVGAALIKPKPRFIVVFEREK